MEYLEESKAVGEDITISENAEDHKTDLHAILINQWKVGQFCDVKVKVKDGSVDLHASVLFGFCPKLFPLVDSCELSNSMEVDLQHTNIAKETIRLIIQYLYTGSITLPEDTNILAEVERATRIFGLKKVEDGCKCFLAEVKEKFKVETHDENSHVQNEVKQTQNEEETMLNSTNTKRQGPKKKDKTKPDVSYINSHLEEENNKEGHLPDTKNNLTLMKESVFNKPKTRSSLSKTMDSIHTLIKQEQEDIEFDEVDDIECHENEFKCFNCYALFDTLVDIESHIKTCSEMQSSAMFECTICGIEFRRECNLTLHKRKTHGDMYYLKCHDCGHQTKTEAELRSHSKQVHDESKPFICDFPGCDYKAWKYNFVRRHKKIHKEIYDYTCENCGKAFSQVAGLISHQRTCYERHEFLCDLCGKAFNHLQSMKTHRRAKHYQEKPYSCETCGSRFSDHRNFKRHKRIHENSYPYCCEVCGKCYRHSNSLKAHMVKHTNNRELTGKNTFRNLGFQLNEVETATSSNVNDSPHQREETSNNADYSTNDMPLSVVTSRFVTVNKSPTSGLDTLAELCYRPPTSST